jgi:hypothetical protein
METVRDVTQFPEIIWTFHAARPNPDDKLFKRLEPGINRGRVTLYAGIDCNRLFPDLFRTWSALEPGSPALQVVRSNPVRVTDELKKRLATRRSEQIVLEGDDEDRPPRVEICVGRDNELNQLEDSGAKVVFLTGLGGQGKSTLAAQFYTGSQSRNLFSYFVWRDCKEESERFENQIASVIERLSGGRLRGEELSKQDAVAVVEILLKLISGVGTLFVFDNVDHYVDLESERMAGALGVFVDSLLRSDSPSRAVFTCRPSIAYNDRRARSIHLAGLTLPATIQLFEKRGASADRHAIEEAHELTEGHAFWLDLLAIQVAKPSSDVDLATLVDQIRSGRGPLPDKTLNSIWDTLKEREQFVLRAMAETVKPVSEVEISEYLRDELSFNKVLKALNGVVPSVETRS